MDFRIGVDFPKLAGNTTDERLATQAMLLT